MKVWHIIVLFSLGAFAADFSTFKENDIKQFLHDRKIDTSDRSYEELTKLADEEWAKLKGLRSDRKITVDVGDGNQQQILTLATDPNADLGDIFPHNWDYLTNDKTPYKQVKDWVFESWTADNLKSYLDSNKVKYGRKSTKQDLIDKAKESWDKVVKQFDVSGSYAGDWLYLSWSLDGIKGWLQEHEVQFDPKASKDELLSLVKDNSYLASLSSIDNRNSLLDLFNLPNLNIFDGGSIKADFIDSWSYSQLREWLYYHGLVSEKPGVNSDKLSIDKLKKLAKSNVKYLESDVNSWIASTKDAADPYLSKKPKDWKASLDGVINSSFLVGIDNWSKERLKQFLRARNVRFSLFSTKRQLIELVKSSKDLPVKESSSPNWFFESWSTDSLRDWLKEKGQQVEGSRDDLINGVSNYYKNFQFTDNSLQSEIKNYKPDFDDFKYKLDKKYGKNKAKSDATILAAFLIASAYYNTASKSLGEKYGENKFELEQALQDVQDSAFDYTVKLVDGAKGAELKVKDHADAVSKAATDYANTLSTKLIESYKNVQNAAEETYESTTGYAQYLADLVKGKFHAHKPKADTYAKEAGKQYDQATKKAGEHVNKAGEHIDYATKKAGEHYEYAAQKVGEHYDYAAQKAGEAAEKAGEHYDYAAQKAGEAAKKAGEHYDNAASNAQSAYSEYKPGVENAARKSYENVKESYENAKEYVGSTNDAVQSAYAEYKPQVENSIKNSYNYLVKAYTNADLKAYLGLFGFSVDFLNSLNRGQLIKLSEEQSKIFFGQKSKWDKSISEVISDGASQVQGTGASLWRRITSVF